MFILFLAILFAIIAGGFVAGRIAKKDELFSACAVGVVGLIFEILFCSFLPFRYNVLLLLLVLPCAYLGGAISVRTKRDVSGEASVI